MEFLVCFIPSEDIITKTTPWLHPLHSHHPAKLWVSPAKNNEIGRLFLTFLYPFEDDILKLKQNILFYVYIPFSKTGNFACQGVSEIGRLFSAFLYPFEDDILKQNQKILSIMSFIKTGSFTCQDFSEIGRKPKYFVCVYII